MPRKKKPKSIKSLAIPKLREASRWWHEKKAARELAKEKVEIGVFKNGNPKFKTYYRCASCDDLFDIKETHMDHIEPVIDPDVGFVDWNTYMERLFVPKEKYQLLCTSCHDIKTEAENDVRRKRKKT